MNNYSRYKLTTTAAWFSCLLKYLNLNSSATYTEYLRGRVNELKIIKFQLNDADRT